MQNTSNDAYIQRLIERDVKRKESVKLYSMQRSAKNDFYKSYFEKHANAEDKKQLKTITETVTL